MTAKSMISPTIFRAYDIRGVVDLELTEESVYLIGRAIGAKSHQRHISQLVVARDGRLSGPRLQRSLIEGILASGIDVIDIGAVPTPVLYFATEHFNTASGIMLTGSHNPPNYNGIKMLLAGESLSGEAISRLHTIITEKNFVDGQGELTEQNVSNAYLTAVVANVSITKPLHVVIDAGNGITGHIAPQLFRQLGCQVTELYCDVDGHFPNHHPDPSQPENCQPVIDKVLELGADIGFAFDGDGDRMGLITNRGENIAADRVLMFFAQQILQHHPGRTVIYDVKCSKHLATVISAAGGEPLMWKTGHSLIKQKIKAVDAVFAGEMSGHIFFRDKWFGFDDGMYSAVRACEMLSHVDKKASDVFATLPNALATPEMNIPCADEKKFTFIKQLIQQGQFGDGKIMTLDGLRVDYEDGWGLVRCSNTTPVLVLRFEADSPLALQRIQSIFKGNMLAVMPSLDLSKLSSNN